VGHGWNTAMGLAADLQMAAALPGVDLVEYIGGSPYVDELTVEGFALDADGMLAIPSAPGWGVTPDRDRIARFCPDADRLFAA
jgi:L-alanine-DL-glutamate epimerase-like enolase superfamily enzyme